MHTILILTISFIALIWAANHLVTGACGLSAYYQLSPLIIGLTIVAIGTTIPELIVSIISYTQNHSDVTISNTIGSNIANIGLVLGLTILIKPATLGSNSLKKTYPILIIVMLFVYSLILDDNLGKIDGCLLLIVCIGVVSGLLYFARQTTNNDPLFNQFKSAVVASRSLKTNITSIILGLVVLPISAKYIVNNASELASWSGMSELTIGLTIHAIGTTLPELSTSIIAALKDQEELSIGTILGSNIYNLLLILAFPAIINPSKINAIILWRDMPVMIGLTVLLLFLNFNYKKNLSPWHGGILLIIYCSYIISLVIKANS